MQRTAVRTGLDADAGVTSASSHGDGHRHDREIDMDGAEEDSREEDAQPCHTNKCEQDKGRGKRSLSRSARKGAAFWSKRKIVTLCWPTDLVCVMVPHTWCHHRCFRLPHVEGYAACCQQMPLEKVVHFSPTFFKSAHNLQIVKVSKEHLTQTC